MGGCYHSRLTVFSVDDAVRGRDDESTRHPAFGHEPDFTVNWRFIFHMSERDRENPRATTPMLLTPEGAEEVSMHDRVGGHILAMPTPCST